MTIHNINLINKKLTKVIFHAYVHDIVFVFHEKVSNDKTLVIFVAINLLFNVWLVGYFELRNIPHLIS